MAILNKADFMARLQERVGEDTSDDVMSFLEDMTDTYNDLESKSTGTSDEQWQTKLDDLDKSWREKYKARFFNSETTPADVIDDQTDDVISDGEEVTFEDLFEERED